MYPLHYSRQMTSIGKESERKCIIIKQRVLKDKLSKQAERKKAMFHISWLKWNGLANHLQQSVAQIRQGFLSVLVTIVW